MAVEEAAATPAKTGKKTPPGPKGKPLLGNVLDFKRDTVSAIVGGWRNYGDAVLFRGAGPFFPLYLFAHPDHIQYIFQDNFRNYRRQDFLRKKFQMVVGNGLVTSEGDSWVRQRKLAQTAFQRERLNALAPAMTDTTDEVLARWRELAQRHEPIDIQSEMMHLILGILTRTLFGADMSGDAAAVEHSVATQAKYLNDRLNSPFDIPERTPIPSQRRFLEARETLNRVVDSVIADRRRTGEDAGDLLSILLEARDEETGEPISDEQARDEIKTLLIAGHETTATTLGWTFYLLSKHPEVAEQVRAELAEVLGDRPPTAEDVPNLKYTTMVLHESLRLYPPLWIVSRMPVEDDEVGGYPIKAGASIIICSYVTHRHPEFWDNPEGFEPERHTPERMKERHRYSYIPFGGGPRGCIGFPFAIMEMPLVLARAMQQFRLSLVPGFSVEPESAISLRQRRGALMNIEPR
jgi:enediyne biosynthesis protein E7